MDEQKLVRALSQVFSSIEVNKHNNATQYGLILAM